MRPRAGCAATAVQIEPCGPTSRALRPIGPLPSNGQQMTLSAPAVASHLPLAKKVIDFTLAG